MGFMGGLVEGSLTRSSGGFGRGAHADTDMGHFGRGAAEVMGSVSE